MSYTLSRMQVGEVFRITDREGKTRHGFFAGKYKTPDHQDWTYYNFLYWVASPPGLHPKLSYVPLRTSPGRHLISFATGKILFNR